MKICAILDNEVSVGGGFNQALTAILQMQRLTRQKHTFVVVTTKKQNIATLADLGIDATYIKLTFIDRLFTFIMFSVLLAFLASRMRLVSPFEKKVTELGTDLIYFTTPSLIISKIQRLNFISTIWDVAHVDFPEFPEVRDFQEFRFREYLYSTYLKAAAIVIVDSDSLRQSIIRRYDVNSERIIIMPFSPNPEFQRNASLDADIFKEFQLKKDFLLYPAQFWSHKNHIGLIKAISILKKKWPEIQVALVGTNKGNLSTVSGYLGDKQLGDHVKCLGFVTSDQLKELYKKCSIVIMPTYFGPTNIPPLEAWMFEKPVIYSQHLNEQTKDAAVYIDPDSPESIAAAIDSVFDRELRAQLIYRGNEALKETEIARKKAELELSVALSLLSARFQAFKPS